MLLSKFSRNEDLCNLLELNYISLLKGIRLNIVLSKYVNESAPN